MIQELATTDPTNATDVHERIWLIREDSFHSGNLWFLVILRKSAFPGTPQASGKELDDAESELLNQCGSSGVLKSSVWIFPFVLSLNQKCWLIRFSMCKGIMPQGRGILPVDLAARLA
jgi:hypothetical protein